MADTVRQSPRPISRTLANAFLVGAVLIAVLPLLLVAVNTFKPHASIVANPLSLPTSFDFSNFARAWRGGNFGVGLVNSLLLSGTTVVLTLVCASLAAVALARQHIAGWKLVTIYFLCATTVPIQLFLFPLYFVFARLGLVGNFAATGVVLTAINLPVAIFLLRAYVISIPREIDDAAFMDGANSWQTFRYILLPLMQPGLITVAIIVFLNSWNEFLITSTFQKGRDNVTMTLGYLSMNGTYATDQGAMMAGAFILVAPIVVFFLVMQRYFVSGMSAGAVKG
ncbi:carbohydrate ABC transporter permease [Pelagibacterium halotolerans]|uniref:sn-glycerol-3-phosphate transport system permease protein UgpE n=1 Tax=Pelagibacterium halotolerans (strain DSM 22347 / JCM 15775 / CGMCC 1.7692 / B2) TaxID=1082931 RepID=G4REL9_PELHB|nr:carbohydrate ABC transporter permease [Pelagibacterium halotolerans]AEQ50869.1 sugar ABC transporter, permease protein, ThuG [Pelagibacterium halotolerans B2]QJR19221.1 carbohydrate ABC transporter permease [Pelagibacterium halotolerans]SDZ98475.1 carbohydrate ABC transporter membrane protein 2, CUT1 family [Pelagibacterium halotolerans]